MAGLRAAELEVLFTANTDDVAKAEKDVKTAGDRIEKQKATKKVDADARPALEGMERVEQAARKIVSAKTIATVDANIDKAEAATEAVRDRLDYLRSVETDLEVKADISRAEANLQRMQRELDALRSARTKIDIEVDTSGAEQAASGLADTVGDSGQDAGAKFSGSVIAALAAIPVAGSVIGIGVAIGQALSDGVKDGLQQEVGRDRLQALTGISEQDAARLGRTASEAYVNGFGESIEANMDTTRLGLQFDLIDPEATNRDAQKVVEGLSGIADVLSEDVQPVAVATTQLLRSGLAKSSQEAFDILAAGARNGINASEDMLDTFIEYPVVLAKLGLSGEEALGLINQGLKDGARNSDLVADALKEVQIRATDGSTASAEGYKLIGLNAEEMTAKIAAGGEGAKEGLQQILTGLRDMEDPLQRNLAAVALFGPKAEDLGDALFALDLSTAVAQLDGVTGSAQKMFDTLASNDASKIEGALRSIEVASNGVKGALAAAFGEGLGELATFVTENRGPVLQFLSDMVNGAIDFGQSIIESAAGGTEAFGEFVAGPGRDAVLLIANLMHLLGQDTTEIEDLASDMDVFDEKAESAAGNIRGLSDNLENGRGKFNEFFDPQIDLGFLNDKTMALASAIDAVGYSADGSKIALDGVDLANLSASESGATLEQQVRNSISAMSEEVAAAGAAGESQEQLAGRYDTATNALVGQLVQMGLTEEQARDLIGTINQTPGQKSTYFDSNANQQRGNVELLGNAIVTLPDGSVIVTADTATATAKIDQFVRDLNNIPGRRDVVINQVVQTTGADRGAVAAAYKADGGVMEFFAQGGMRGLTPMQPIAQMVPASTWRVVGDRSDVPEAYIPLDGSPRSMAILAETMRRMGVEAMSEGGTTTVATQRPPATDRPVYMDGGALFGVIREVADGTARLIVADALDRRTQDAQRGKWR
ncbi:hypothetical protein C5C74_08290 [Rathayibacter sp. AY1E8]|uniref:phage tail tape measure protein n=1 Tax=Rathayibacter sp. AY1E8 TaxID=2080555 RepID=UPI000CE7C0E7|nr:phage tail tape measure protein [Rathayibacter sp. AY1E8]PPG18965.1 hypothetical protein C5C74_08290 [Rathayibacter sp. AY1E8]